MENDNTILDFEQERQNPEHYLASSGLRLANYLLDRIGWYIMLFFFGVISEALGGGPGELRGKLDFLVVLSFPGYWIVFEYFLGKTPAKFVTGTKVISKTGKRASFWQIVGRTFARLIPFNAFSFLFSSKAVGWHDSLSETRVVRDTYTEWESELV